MHLPLLAITALIGGWIFTNIVFSTRDAAPVAQPSISSNKKLSLWSLIFFLFFP